MGNNTRERNGQEKIKTMLEEYLQKLDNLALERLSSQATKLLNSEPRQAELGKPDKRQIEQSANQVEEINGKRYHDMPEMDARTLRAEKIEPGTIREKVVQEDVGHDGAVLITPVRGHDDRYVCPRAIMLMTNQPLQYKPSEQLTGKQ